MPYLPHLSFYVLHDPWPPQNLALSSPIEVFTYSTFYGLLEIYTPYPLAPSSKSSYVLLLLFFEFLKIPIHYACPPHTTLNQYYQYVTAHQAVVKLCQTLHATSCRNTPIVNMMQQGFLMILVLEARLTPYISSSSF